MSGTLLPANKTEFEADPPQAQQCVHSLFPQLETWLADRSHPLEASLGERCHRDEVDMDARSAAAASDHTIVWVEFEA